MTKKLDDLFVDVGAYRPVGKWQAGIRELMVWLMALMLLLAGWYFKEWMITQFRYLALVENAPSVPYPAQWPPQPAPDRALLVLDPNSQSAFPAREEVLIASAPEQPLDVAWPEQRQRTLSDYHELGRLNVTLANGQPALLLTYTYVAETNASQTTSLTIVRADDLAFVINDGREDRLIVLTLAADSHDWENHQSLFHRILQRMGVAVL